MTDTIGLDLYKRAFDEATTGMGFIDTSWRFVVANEAFCKMFEYPLSELLSKSILELTHPDDINRTTEKLAKVFAGSSGGYKIEKRYLTKSGDIVWGLVSTFPIKDKTGKVIYCFGVIEDITSRKKLETSLKESETLYHTLVDLSPDGIAIHAQGKVLFANPSGLRMLGAQRLEDVVGKPTMSFVHPESQQIVAERIKRMMEEGAPAVLLAEKFVRLDGGVIDVEVTASPILFQGTKAIQVVFHDLTKQLENQKAVIASEARYRGLAEAAHDMIFVLDREGTIIYVNSFAAAQFGIKPEEMIGRKRAEFFGPSSEAQDISLGKVFESGQPIYRETRTPFKDKMLWLGTWLVPLKEDGGEVTGILGVSRDISTQKEAELELLQLNRTLKTSEESYRGLFDSVTEAIYIQDREGRFVDVNPGAVKMYGYPREWFIGKTPLDVAAEGKNDMEKIKKKVERAFAGEPQEFEFWGVRSNGEVFLKEVRLYKGKYSGKEVVIALATDITERKRTEEGLRLLREAAQAVNEAQDFTEALKTLLRIVCSSVGWVYGEAWIPDVSREKLELSPAWYTVDKELEEFRKLSIGYSFKPGEGLPGRVWLSKKSEWLPDVSVNGSIFPRAKTALAASIKAGLGVPIVVNDQVLAVLVFFAQRIRKEEKDFIEIISSMGSQLSLVFRRKNAEEELRRSEEKYRNLVDSMSEGIGVQDKNGLITFMNKRACEMLGYELEELVGKPMSMVFDSENQKILREQMALRHKGEHQSYEIAWLRKDGSKINTIIAPNPRFDEQGNLTESIAVFTDITARKEQEKKRDEFIMIANHELRAPMTAIRWMISMILDGTYGKIDEKLGETISGMGVSVDRLIELINDMISISRIEGGGIKFSSEEFDIKTLLDNLVTIFEPEMKKKGLSFDLSLVRSAILRADADKMAQILSNLIDNSIKFTNKGTVSLSVEEEGEKVRIAVADTGMGIDGELQKRLFGKFVQAPSAEGEVRGTGLGLYISREIARNMGGDLILENSELGKGSTFVLSLPLNSG